MGPVRDAFNIGDNPQFSLEVQPNTSGTIWILLTRHITDIADFRQNQEYITVLVYRNAGKRVYYPSKNHLIIFLKRFYRQLYLVFNVFMFSFIR